jgi:hypothetical protein
VVTISPDVPVVSTVGASSLKSFAWHEKWGMSPIFSDVLADTKNGIELLKRSLFA